jgi:hypothetical protein
VSEIINSYNLVVTIPEEDYLMDLGVDGRMTVKYILNKHGMRVWIRFKWLRTESNGGIFSTQ